MISRDSDIGIPGHNSLYTGLQQGDARYLGAGMCSDFDMKALASAAFAFRSTRLSLRQHDDSTIGGGCTSTHAGESARAFVFGDSAPITLSLGGFQACGTGGQCWDASVVLALFLRQHEYLCSGSDVLELGAGCGLPGIDIARRRGARSVTVTDAPPAMLELLRSNVRASAADARVARLDWSDPADVAAARPVDVLVGADVCWSGHEVGPLESAIRGLRAPVAVLASLASRTAFADLVARLGHGGDVCNGFDIEEHELTLLSSDAEAEREATELGLAPSAPQQARFRVVVLRPRPTV